MAFDYALSYVSYVQELNHLICNYFTKEIALCWYKNGYQTATHMIVYFLQEAMYLKVWAEVQLKIIKMSW